MVGKRPLAQGYLMSIHLELHKHEVNSFIFFIIRTDDRAFLSVYLAFICFVFSPPGYVYIIFYGMLCVIAKYFLATYEYSVFFVANLIFSWANLPYRDISKLSFKDCAISRCQIFSISTWILIYVKLRSCPIRIQVIILILPFKRKIFQRATS